MGMVVSRFDIFLVTLDPTVGSEIRKTRPCLVLSPDVANRHIGTVIVAPMTSGKYEYPTRVRCEFDGRKGFVVLDQIRTVDKARLVKLLGRADTSVQKEVLAALQELFSE